MAALDQMAALYRDREQLPLRTRLLVTFGAVAVLHAAAVVLFLSGAAGGGQPLVMGLVLTAYLALFLGSYSGMNAASAVKIVLQIVVPFILGQLLNRKLGRWAQRRALPLKVVDRGAILLVVYAAFGSAVANGLWERLPQLQLMVTGGLCALMLALALVATSFTARKLGFARADATAIMFGGSEKSLAAGLPISAILFHGPLAGVVILPVIMYHAMQLVVCAAMARWMAKRTAPGPAPEPSAAGEVPTLA